MRWTNYLIKGFFLISDPGISIPEASYVKPDYPKPEYVKNEYAPSSEQLQSLHSEMAGMAYPAVSSKSSPYSVNGISLSSPSVDMLHPGMGYPSE